MVGYIGGCGKIYRRVWFMVMSSCELQIRIIKPEMPSRGLIIAKDHIIKVSNTQSMWKGEGFGLFSMALCLSAEWLKKNNFIEKNLVFFNLYIGKRVSINICSAL